jgi:hypothetical protein
MSTPRRQHKVHTYSCGFPKYSVPRVCTNDRVRWVESESARAREERRLAGLMMSTIQGRGQRLACVLSEQQSKSSAAADSAWARSTRASETGSTSPEGPSRNLWTGPLRCPSRRRHPVSKTDNFHFIFRRSRERAGEREENGGQRGRRKHDCRTPWCTQA